MDEFQFDGIRVTVQGSKHRRVAHTDDAGRFRFETVPEGSREVEANLGPLQARAPVAEGPVTIRLPASCTLAGRVVSATSAEPVNLAVVRCGDRTVQTGPRGTFRMEEVPIPDARPPLIEVGAPGYAGLRFRPDMKGGWEDLFLRMRPR